MHRVKGAGSRVQGGRGVGEGEQGGRGEGEGHLMGTDDRSSGVLFSCA